MFKSFKNRIWLQAKKLHRRPVYFTTDTSWGCCGGDEPVETKTWAFPHILQGLEEASGTSPFWAMIRTLSRVIFRPLHLNFLILKTTPRVSVIISEKWHGDLPKFFCQQYKVLQIQRGCPFSRQHACLQEQILAACLQNKDHNRKEASIGGCWTVKHN